MKGVAWALLVGDSSNEPYMFAVIGAWLLFRDPGGEWLGQEYPTAAKADKAAAGNTKLVEGIGGRLIRGPVEVETVQIFFDQTVWVSETGMEIQRALYRKAR